MPVRREMNEELKKMFAAASKGLNLTNEEKVNIVQWYKDELHLIPKLGQDTFTFLVHQRVKQMRLAREISLEMTGTAEEVERELHGDAKD